MTPNDCHGKCECHTTADLFGKANNMVAPISNDGWVEEKAREVCAKIIPLTGYGQLHVNDIKPDIKDALLEAEKRGREML